MRYFSNASQTRHKVMQQKKLEKRFYNKAKRLANRLDISIVIDPMHGNKGYWVCDDNHGESFATSWEEVYYILDDVQNS